MNWHLIFALLAIPAFILIVTIICIVICGARSDEPEQPCGDVPAVPGELRGR